MLHPRGSGRQQEAAKGLKAVPGVPRVWQREGTRLGGLREGGSELGHSPQGRGSLLEHGHPGEAGITKSHPRPPCSRRNAPPGLTQPSLHPTGPSQPPCPAPASGSRAWVPSAALTSRGFQIPPPTGQGAKTCEELLVASPGPSCPQICPRVSWQRHRHLQGHTGDGAGGSAGSGCDRHQAVPPTGASHGDCD